MILLVYGRQSITCKSRSLVQFAEVAGFMDDQVYPRRWRNPKSSFFTNFLWRSGWKWRLNPSNIHSPKFPKLFSLLQLGLIFLKTLGSRRLMLVAENFFFFFFNFFFFVNFMSRPSPILVQNSFSQLIIHFLFPGAVNYSFYAKILTDFSLFSRNVIHCLKLFRNFVKDFSLSQDGVERGSENGGKIHP